MRPLQHFVDEPGDRPAPGLGFGQGFGKQAHRGWRIAAGPSRSLVAATSAVFVVSRCINPPAARGCTA